MFQSFSETAHPDQGPPRLAALQAHLKAHDIAATLIPRADIHQGEYVAPGDERLAWLTGFTGSAGFCIVTQDNAGVFIDGRYTEQVRAQVDMRVFTPVNWPATKPAAWLKEALPEGGAVTYDPRLHTGAEIEKLREGLPTGFTLSPQETPIDTLWSDRPARPEGAIRVQPIDLAGEPHASKRARLADDLVEADHNGALITLPDAIAWLLNIRGSDIPRNPIPQAFALLHDDARVTLFVDAAKLDDTVRAHLGNDVAIAPYDAVFEAAEAFDGTLRLDKSSAPIIFAQSREAAGRNTAWGEDPCLLPKSRKNAAEIAATRAAHLRDAAAMCEFLTWFDEDRPATTTEIDIARKLEECRAATGALLDISFDTIAGSGPHGALPHYRVTEATNRQLLDGDLLVLDSGGQYEDGTTDITRTLPVGTPGADERVAFTRVLQGMIAVSRLRWPAGYAGRDLDALARYPLWLADQDYAHGTGHGVGVALCVHEGPQRLSKVSEVPFEPGMIVSNEPGYYRQGAFGIRIENIVVVTEATPLPGGDVTGKLCFETLNFVPIDQRLIDVGMLSQGERDWLNDYHAQCRDKITPLLSKQAAEWLNRVTASL
ncbi:MAG: aminopeptidase P family protein [Pseudomonadota bacterium]